MPVDSPRTRQGLPCHVFVPNERYDLLTGRNVFRPGEVDAHVPVTMFGGVRGRAVPEVQVVALDCPCLQGFFVSKAN